MVITNQPDEPIHDPLASFVEWCKQHAEDLKNLGYDPVNDIDSAQVTGKYRELVPAADDSLARHANAAVLAYHAANNHAMPSESSRDVLIAECNDRIVKLSNPFTNDDIKNILVTASRLEFVDRKMVLLAIKKQTKALGNQIGMDDLNHVMAGIYDIMGLIVKIFTEPPVDHDPNYYDQYAYINQSDTKGFWVTRENGKWITNAGVLPSLRNIVIKELERVHAFKSTTLQEVLKRLKDKLGKPKDAVLDEQSITDKLKDLGYARMSIKSKGYWLQNVDLRGVFFKEINDAELTSVIRGFVMAELGDCSEHDINEALGKLRDASHVNEELFIPDKNITPFKDCVLLIDKNKIVSYSLSQAEFDRETDEYNPRCKICIPYNFPTMLCTIDDDDDIRRALALEYERVRACWIRSLNRVFSSDPVRIRLFRMFCGCLLYRSNEMKKALLLIGPLDSNEKNNAGKTTLYSIIVHALGEDNGEIEKLQLFCKNQFASSVDSEKMVVCEDELPKNTVIGDIDSFKTSIGSKRMRSERKGVDPRQAYIFFKWWVNANDVFYMAHIDTDFTKKVLLLKCDARFTDVAGEVDESKKIYPIDRMFESNMTSDIGTFYILKWMVAGLRDFIKNKLEFIGAMDAHQVKDFWDERVDIIRKFIKDRCVLESYSTNQNAYITKDEFMAELGKYAIDIKWTRSVPEKIMISKHCHEYGFHQKRKWLRPDDAPEDTKKRETEIYAGIRLKTNVDKLSEAMTTDERERLKEEKEIREKIKGAIMDTCTFDWNPRLMITTQIKSTIGDVENFDDILDSCIQEMLVQKDSEIEIDGPINDLTDNTKIRLKDDKNKNQGLEAFDTDKVLKKKAVKSHRF